jgi:hypothetical protein
MLFSTKFLDTLAAKLKYSSEVRSEGGIVEWTEINSEVLLSLFIKAIFIVRRLQLVDQIFPTNPRF